MIKGDLCVKILENNQHRDVVVREGEFFLLPAKIPHSPQRTANSCGLVIERRRHPGETDGVRWFVPHQTQVLYEKWFHCKDLGIELIPLIKNFFASEEYKTKQPGENVLPEADVPFKLNQATLSKHDHGAYNLFEKISQMNPSYGIIELSLPGLQFQVSVLRKGQYRFDVSPGLDQWLWQLAGCAAVRLDSEETLYEMGESDSLLVPEDRCAMMSVEVRGEEGLLMRITQDPGLKQ
jgi:3-hydroxyanthranilate 3,4-dioxygenase